MPAPPGMRHARHSVASGAKQADSFASPDEIVDRGTLGMALPTATGECCLL